MLGYYAQGIIYGGTVLLGGGLRSPSAFVVIIIDLRQEVYVFAGVYLFVVCEHHNSKSYGSILM